MKDVVNPVSALPIRHAAVASTLRARCRAHWRAALFGTLLVLFGLLTLGIVIRSPIVTLDQDVLRLDLRRTYPQWFYPLHTFVIFGQRAPATIAALPWFLWRAWKSRSARPIVTLLTALFLLNGFVGVVKLAVGRLGPSATHQAYSVFDGGDIFPSGHVSNSVVLYGVIAMLAVGHRRAIAVIAAVLSFLIGLTTIYLDTHWLSDVVGGWLAGALVLLALPYTTDLVVRLTRRALRAGRHLWLAVRPRPEDVELRVPGTISSLSLDNREKEHERIDADESLTRH